MGIHNPSIGTGGGGAGNLNDAYNFPVAGAGRTITTLAAKPVDLTGPAGLHAAGPIVSDSEVRVADLSFTDPVCASCGEGFSVDQELRLKVVSVVDEGKPITYTQPVHVICN